MFKPVVSICAAIFLAGSASAATLDLTDPAFANSFPSGGATDSASVTVDGVTFTVEATSARGVNGFRQNGTGLYFGIGGNGMNIISITASEDVVFEGITGRDTSLSSRTTPSRYDGSVEGLAVFTDLSLPTTLGTVDFADFTLTQGDTFALAFDFEARTGFSAVFASAAVSGFEFSTIGDSSVSAVPLPAGLPLLVAGLGAFGWIRRKQTV